MWRAPRANAVATQKQIRADRVRFYQGARAFARGRDQRASGAAKDRRTDAAGLKEKAEEPPCAAFRP
jgi:hypothetical protein